MVARMQKLIIFLPVIFGALTNAQSENSGKANSSQTVSPGQTQKGTSTECTPDRMTPFCWWAIDLVTATQFVLYRNGMSDLLERNIQFHCRNSSKTIVGDYGFSFMNITTDIPYVNVYVSDGQQLAYEQLQKVLVESKTDEEIIEDLTTEFYKRRPIDADISLTKISARRSDYCINIDGDKEAKTLGGASCMFLLDVNTPTKVHAGAMHWNKIDLMKQSSEREKSSLVDLALKGHFCAEYSVHQIPDGNCVRYASLREYFVLCCCYTDPDMCAYSISNSTNIYVEMNRIVWGRNLRVRRPVVADEVRGKAYGIKTSQWTYRDFIYSKPLKLGARGQIISTGRNIPLWHCAVGQFLVYSHHNITLTPPQLELFERKKLPPRTQYCIADIIVEFKRGKSETVVLEAAADTQGKCSSMQKIDCQLVGPDCLNDLIHISHVQAEYRCCCNRGNLCNHWGNNNPSKSDYQLTLTPESFQDLAFQCYIGAVSYLVQVFAPESHSSSSKMCWRAFDFHFDEEIIMIDGISYQDKIAFRVGRVDPLPGYLSCETLNVYPLRRQNCHRKDYLHQQITYQFFKCECRTMTLMMVHLYGGKTCDEKVHLYFEQHKRQLVRPNCYELYGEKGPLSIEMYSLGVRTNFSKIIAAIRVTNSTPICVNFIKFTKRGISFGAYALRPAKTIAEVQKSKRFMTDTYRSNTIFIQRCQSNLTKPCNGFDNFAKHLLSFGVQAYSRKREPSSYSRCFATSNLRRVNCQTTFGCFDFHTISGFSRRGCIEDIPEIVKEEPELAVLKYCIHVEMWRARAFICNAVRYMSRPNDTEPQPGVICCCKGTCPLSNQNLSPTNMKRGFSIFETITD